MTRTRGTCLAVLSAMVLSTLALVALPVSPASATQAPLPTPPGPVNGSGSFQGTEQVLTEQFLGIPCFKNEKTIFALRGIGTYAGVTAGGQPVAYKAEIGPNDALYAAGPIQLQMETFDTYYHGITGTHGLTDSACTDATIGAPIPAEFRIFSPDHIYNLDGGGAQVPCVGHGTFSRGGDWQADWSLDADCTVVGNAAGTPGTGAAPKGTEITHLGTHNPCSDVCTSNINFDYKQYLAIRGSGVTLVGSTASAQVGDNVVATARLTNDGVAVPATTVNFTTAGPAPTTPPSGSGTTGSDGRATFSFTASAVGDYTVTASAPSATNPGTFVTANLAVTFTPPDPPTIVVSGPTTAPTQESQTFMATFTDARVPVSGSTINFSVTGAGTATPATGSAVTDATGKASFSFAGDRAGSYTLTASTTYNAQSVTGTAAMVLSINTFYRAGGVALASGENNLTSAIVDPGGHFGYFGTNTSPGRVVKVDLGTMAEVGAITLNSGEGGLSSAVMDPTGHFAYFGTADNPAKVVKVDLTTFSRVGAITLASGEGSLKSAVMDPAGHYAYFGTAVSSATGMVVKVDLTSFSRVGAVTFASDETQVLAAVMAPGGALAYFAARGTSTTGAGRLVKVDLSSFTRVGAVDLVGSQENWLTSAVIDPAGHFAYLGTRSYPSLVIKVDLDAFTRVGALTLDGFDGVQEADLFSAVIAPDGGHAYFATSSTSPSIPSQVIEVDLGTFSRARTVTLPTTELNLTSAAVAPDGTYAYFGTATSPGHVVKVALVRPPNPELVAGADSYTTPYAVPLTVSRPGVLANDADSGDPDPLVAGQASTPAGGSVVLNPDGSFTYTPNVGFSGTDTFTYTASDGQDYSAPATVSIAVGMAPDQVSDTFGGAYGFYTNVGLFGGPITSHGGPTSSCGQPSQPACATGESPAVSLPRTGGDYSASDHDGNAGTYGPANIFENHGSLDVHTTGSTGPSGSVTSSSSVHNVQDNDPFHAGSPDGEVSSTCTATQDGVSGSSHITNGYLVVHTDPTTGDPTETVTFDHDYDPAPNTEYNGALDHVGDHWRIVLNEQILGPDSITVNAVHMYLLGSIARGEMIIGQSRCGVRAAAPDTAPVAGADNYTVTQGQGPLVFEHVGVLANDTDADGSPLTAAKLPGVFPTTQTGDWTFPSDPAHGSLVLANDGGFTYTPDPAYTGPDGFTYVVYDSRGRSDLGHVTITVNSPPVANNDTYGTTANQPVTVAAPGVLSNDTDADGGTLSAAPLDNPAHGSVSLNADGSFTYTPVANFVGTDSFTYVLSDGQGGTAEGTVSLPVAATNHPPVAAADTYTTNEDTPLVVGAPGVLGNDTDADSNPLTAAVATGPTHGTLSLNADGSFTYTSAANYNGTDSFTYNVSDGQGASATATVTLNITAVNDPPVAGNDSYSTNENTPLSVAAPGVLANDSDIDSPTITAGSATTPAHGSVVLNSDGSFTYTPAPNYHGADSFTYKANDGSLDSAPATVSITVVFVPQPPVAGADTYTAYNGTPLNVAAPGVLANDTDVDGNTLTASLATSPANGTVTLNSDGSFTYNANVGFVGTDTFTYTVNDGHGLTDTGHVTINVHPGQATLLKDLNPGSGESSLSGFTQMGNAVYFYSYDVATQGLWRTDGTAAGTVLVKSDDLSNNGDYLTVMGNSLYFVGYDSTNGYELWKSDGTTAGTALVKDINPGTGSSFLGALTAIANTLYFEATDGVHGYELWKSDGTTAGTTLVKDINPGSADSDPTNFVAVGTIVFFMANDGVHGQELWKTDGTAAGTVMVKDIDPGASKSFIDFMTAFGNTLIFSASSSGFANNEPWISDGTDAGTVMLKDICPGTNGSGPGGFFVWGNSVLFRASDCTHGPELWKTDGTAAGTVMVADINLTPSNLGPNGSSPAMFTALGNTVLFVASDGTTSGDHGSELWKTDGTAAGTVMVKDVNQTLRSGTNAGTNDSSITQPVVVNGSVYFSANDGIHGLELWKTDATTAGTVLVQDIKPGAGSSLVGSIYSYLTPALGTLFFQADDGIHGLEPWRLTPGPTAISASAASVTAGTSVTAIWTDIASPTATDWVGLYSSSGAAEPALLSWAYTGGSPNGSVNVAVPLSAPPGTTYELRLFTNNTYTRLATSAPFTVVASATTVSASPSTVTAGSPVTATWSGITAPSATDWVGLYPSGSTPDPALVAWAYTGGAAGGNLNLTVPAGSAPGGSYELRLYTNNTYTRLATSTPFSVVASSTAIAASPSSVNAGGPVVATWSAISSPSGTDWVGLYPTSSTPDPAALAWAYTNGNANGTLNLVVPLNSTAGATYELRLFSANSYTCLATSTPFGVTASAATISASPASVVHGNPVTATWSGIASPSAADWVGLYANSTDPNTAIVGEVTGGGVTNSWAYTGGTPSGSLILHVPAGSPPGTTYELRLFSANSYTRLATSAPFSVT